MGADLKWLRSLKDIFKNGCTPVSMDTFLDKLASNNLISVLQEKDLRAKESSKQIDDTFFILLDKDPKPTRKSVQRILEEMNGSDIIEMLPVDASSPIPNANPAQGTMNRNNGRDGAMSLPSTSANGRNATLSNFTQDNAIVCSACKQETVSHITKGGVNKGRRYYKCAKPQGSQCQKFFSWADAPPEAQNARVPSDSPGGMSTSTPAAPNALTENVPNCDCGIPAQIAHSEKGMKRTWLEACILLLVLVPDDVLSIHDVLVATTTGAIRGYARKVHEGKIVLSFTGIPYAKPPIGDLRFQKPVPVDPWSGFVNATTLPNSCFQEPSNYFDGAPSALLISLYLYS
ncbi:unnamed protein product [Darwinula stevensoni]|uniref:GRF-type domain-containing protein n=1 Tax=Darwinula stevensoni TaxID=69355 RepID=A0A7R9A6B6_9CRUS|nr:unnamed protein product [Darwinula stevensoni]CAG0888638.1 unnamed protein product [Darwinula stevensoni]